MLKYLLDTNTCIYVMKNRPEQVKQRFIEHQHRVCISSVVLMELMYGAEKSSHIAQNLNAVEDFVANLSILDFDAKASAHTAQIRAQLERKGQKIGSYDNMIAGHARSLGLIVITNNEKEFVRVSGLQVENWL